MTGNKERKVVQNIKSKVNHRRLSHFGSWEDKKQASYLANLTKLQGKNT